MAEMNGVLTLNAPTSLTRAVNRRKMSRRKSLPAKRARQDSNLQPLVPKPNGRFAEWIVGQ
jgi:hypothetical protein